MEDFMDSLVKEVEGNIKPIRAVKMDDTDDVRKNTHTKNKQPVFQKLSDQEEDETAPARATLSRFGRTSRRNEQAGRKKRLQPVFEKDADPPEIEVGPPVYKSAPAPSRQPVYMTDTEQRRTMYAPVPEPQQPLYSRAPESAAAPGMPPEAPAAPAMPPTAQAITSAAASIPQAVPGMTPAAPGIIPQASGIPQMAPGMIQTIAGMPQEAPGYAPPSPGIPQAAPGMPSAVPGMAAVTPGIPSAIPGMPPVIPASPVSEPAASGSLETNPASESSPDAPAKPAGANSIPMTDGDKDIFTHVHRENVKCYRNTQATLVENSNQIRQGLEEIHTNIHGWLLGLLIISIINFGANALLILHMIFGFL